MPDRILALLSQGRTRASRCGRSPRSAVARSYCSRCCLTPGGPDAAQPPPRHGVLELCRRARLPRATVETAEHAYPETAESRSSPRRPSTNLTGDESPPRRNVQPGAPGAPQTPAPGVVSRPKTAAAQRRRATRIRPVGGRRQSRDLEELFLVSWPATTNQSRTHPGDSADPIARSSAAGTASWAARRVLSGTDAVDECKEGHRAPPQRPTSVTVKRMPSTLRRTKPT